MKNIPIDPYVLDTLLVDLVGHDRRPSTFLVYLFLYRHTLGERRRSFRVSHQGIADEVGISKSAVQTAIRGLKRRRLVEAKQRSPTDTPEYTVLRPWRRGR